MPEHWTFAPMESRAITAFNTGHLVFFYYCHYIDSLYNMMWNCEWYEREGIKPKDKWMEEGVSIYKDLVDYLIDLHEFRMKKWEVPLIVVEGWL